MTAAAGEPFQALILAGSRGTPDPVAISEGVPHKALIRLAGETLLARVSQSLTEAGANRIVVSASDAAVRTHVADLGLDVIDADAGPSMSVRNAITALGTPLLVTTADHAMLRPEWVRRFRADIPTGTDAAVLLARRDVIQAAVPETRRTYLRFADGDWSGCNLFQFDTPRSVAALDVWQQVEADRKRPWRIVRRLGAGMLSRYLTGRLSLADALAHLGRLAGLSVAAIESPFGLAAVDVDKAADLDLVRRLISPGSDKV